MLRRVHYAAGPSSLNGVSVKRITLPTSISKVTIGAALRSNPSCELVVKVVDLDDVANASLDTEQFSLTHRGCEELNLDPRKQYYAYVLLISAAGAATNGGANDYVTILAEQEKIL